MRPPLAGGGPAGFGGGAAGSGGGTLPGAWGGPGTAGGAVGDAGACDPVTSLNSPIAWRLQLGHFSGSVSRWI